MVPAASTSVNSLHVNMLVPGNAGERPGEVLAGR